MSRAASALDARVAFLSDARNYGEAPSRVQAIETHLSWVFLTDRHAYKLKKPGRFDDHDLSTVEAREARCRAELELNRRLTQGVYLRVVPLAIDERGAMTLGGGGEPVDWLVQMRRLPGELALDWLVRHGRVPLERLHDAIGLISRHYRGARPEPVSAERWAQRLADLVDTNLHALEAFPQEIALTQVLEIAARQHGFIEGAGRLFEGRVAAGRIVEGHGDLRPEHVFLEARPQIIDCLDLSRHLRVVDAAEELGFLALECERLGAPWLREEILAAHATLSGDHPSPRLVDFYQSVQACVRARLCILHLGDPLIAEPARWSRLARDYLALAAAHMDAAVGRSCARSNNAS